MILIEFIGLPGTGKSTICKEVMAYFTKKGNRIDNIHHNQVRMDPIRRKIFSMSYGLDTRKSEMRRLLQEYIHDAPDPAAKKWAEDILRTLYQLHLQRIQKHDLVFMDEGPIQYLTSIAHSYILDDTVIPIIEEMNRTIYSCCTIALYITADEDAIIGRIKSRNRTTDRFLRGSDDEMRTLLHNKQMNLQFAMENIHYDQLTVIKNDDLQKSIQLAIELIENAQKEEKRA